MLIAPERLLVLAILAASLLGCERLSGTRETEAANTQEFFHSFAGNPVNPPNWQLIGPDCDTCVRFEQEGLRITLPAGHKENANTGLSTFLGIKGNFEITVRYEILREPAAEDSPRQTRFTVYVPIVGKGPAGPSRVTFSRRVRTAGGDEYFPWLLLPDEKSGKPLPQENHFPAPGRSGRLRLIRTGSKVSYWVAEGVDKEFQRLEEFAFSSEDVKNVGLYAASGGPKVVFDVRVLDLHVRAESLSDLPPTVDKPRGRAALVMILFGVLAATLFLGVWWYARRRHIASKPAPTAQELPEPAPSPPNRGSLDH
jgi:hypothetical protein